MNQTWFRAEKEGTYYGQCNELCGVNHSFMPIEVDVVSQAKYDAWIAAHAKKPAVIAVATTPVAAGASAGPPATSPTVGPTGAAPASPAPATGTAPAAQTGPVGAEGVKPSTTPAPANASKG